MLKNYTYFKVFNTYIKKHMKLNFLLYLATLLSVSTFSVTTTAQTLQEAIQQTINENPQIQAAKSERSAVEFVGFH